MDPMALTKAQAKRKYERIGYPRQAGAFSALANTLADGKQSCAFAVLTDSTGGGGATGVGRFPRLAAAALGKAFPAYGVQAATWNEGTQAYDGPYTQVQAPPLGARFMQFSGAATVARHPGDGNPLPTLDVQVKAAFPVWPPPATQVPISRSGNAGARGWVMNVNTTGNIQLYWSPDGTATTFAGGSGVIPVTVNTPIWLRARLTPDNGAGAYVLNYSYSADDRATWVALSGAGTVAGASALFSPAFDYEIGGRNGGSDPLTNGKIYEVHVGPVGSQDSVVPRWVDHWEPQAASITLGGSPMLTLLQGGVPGANITYLNDATRCPKMAARGYHTLAFVLGCSHNDLTRRGGPYLADWDTWLTRVRAQWPYAGLAVTTQNPKVNPASYQMPHRVRHDDIRQWAARNNATLVDAYRAFIETAGYASLIASVDGIHPTVTDGLTDGAALWGRTLTSAILARA